MNGLSTSSEDIINPSKTTSLTNTSSNDLRRLDHDIGDDFPFEDEEDDEGLDHIF